GQVGAVDIQVKSDDFRVINNKIGNLKLDSDFRVTGTVRAPKIEGTIEIEPGTVDVGEILTVASRAPYSTTQAPIGPAGAGIPEPTLPLLPAFFDSSELQLSLAVPGNLLVKGTNIRPAGAAISVGDMSVYVGGAVNLTKAPRERLRVAGEINTVRGSYT